MNVKLRIFGVAAVFLMGAEVYAQRTGRDTLSTKDIDEVVVVGYGTQKKSEVTGSISQVKGSEIAGLAAPSFDSQLAGRASGVQITTGSGVLGEAPRIRIRGINSISSGTYPLVVVDGIPIFTGDTGGYAANNALGDINPADIETFEVLKDGAATAIYGSRAANGVILITTKKGRQGRTNFGYNTYTGFASVTKYFELLETPDFIMISNEKRANRGSAAWAKGDTYNTDWQKAIFRTATQLDHNISLSGGLGKGAYFASFGYTQQDGVTLSNSMQRFTTRLNADQSVTDWLKVGMNIGVTKTNYEGLNTGSASLSGSVFNVLRQLPNTSVFDSNGPFGYNIGQVGSNTMVGKGENAEYIANNLPNIRYVLDHNKNTSKITRIIGNVYADLKMAPYLNFRVQASTDNSENEGFLYWDPFHGDGRGSNGRVQNNTTKFQRYNWQNILTFNKTFGNHNIILTGVNEYQKQDVNSFFAAGTDLANQFFNKNLISGSYGTQLSGGSKSDNALVSLLGRVNYDFAKKYFLQASLRKDKLSSFAEEQRVGIFPGASVGWTITKEPFMEGVKDVLSDLKFRASYGKVGNTQVGNYPYLGLYGLGKYGDLNGTGYSQMGNDLLTWETSKKINYGADIGLFNNKLKLTADYFINDVDGLILEVPVAMSLGIPLWKYNDNVGEVRNWGWEFTADWSPIRTEDFEVGLNANLSLVENEVKKLVGGRDMVYDNNLVREGEPLNVLYGVKYYGVNPANGNPVYYKTDGSLVQGNLATNSYRVFDPNNPGDISKAATSPDRFILGNVLPKYFGAVNLSVRYKQFDLNTLARFSGGNKIMNVTRREMLSQFFNNNSTEILGRWQSAENPGDGWTPRLYASSDPIVNGPTIANSRFVESGDFVKLDNLTLGYNFHRDDLDKFNIQKFRIYIQAQNSFIFTKYKGMDPEMESAGVDYNATPRQRVLSLGLNLSL